MQYFRDWIKGLVFYKNVGSHTADICRAIYIRKKRETSDEESGTWGINCLRVTIPPNMGLLRAMKSAPYITPFIKRVTLAN